jgi:integrase
VIESGTYLAKYRDGEGIVQEFSTGCRTKDGAQSVLKELVDRAEKVRSKILTPGEAATADHQRTPLADHFPAYLDHQTAKGLNKTRIAINRSRLNRLATECSFRHLSDLSATALERWLATRKSEDMSAGNRNEFRQTLVGFGNWYTRTSRLTSNPFGSVAKADTKVDQRRKRRAMTEAELTKLLDAARRRPLLDAMTVRRGERKGKAVANLHPETTSRLELLGRERALLYKTYLLTGLRKSELATLTTGQLELDAPGAFAVLDAADEKNRQGSTIAIRSDLADELRNPN